MNKEALKVLLYWVCERQRIYLAKQAKRPWPWTNDPILQRYSFCNVFREQDRVTVWIDKHLRQPYAKHPHLWFMLCVARLFNRPTTLRQMMGTKMLGAWPHKTTSAWNPRTMLTVLEQMKARKETVFTGAYIVSTNGISMDKAQYVVERVLKPLWEDRKVIYTVLNRKQVTLAQFHDRLTGYNGLGSFLAAQVIADLKQVKEQPLADAEDWYSWAASGPGSRRGLNRLMGRDKKAPWKEADWLYHMTPVRGQVDMALHKAKLVKASAEICMQDTQNCLCEFDKYIRTKNGEGRPRSTYTYSGTKEEA